MTDDTASPPHTGLVGFAELLTVTSFAIAQPLLEVVGGAVQELAAAGATPRVLVAYALAVVMLPPVFTMIAEVLAGLLGRRLRDAIHLLAIGGFIGVFTVQVLLGRLAPLALGLTGVAAVGGSIVAVQRFAPVRLWLRYAAFAPLLFLGQFLLTSPAAEMLRAAREGQPAASVESPAPVVLIVFDELPTATLLGQDGAIDESLFPNIAALAVDGTWFRHATTTSNATYHAVPALLTGRGPVDAAPLTQSQPDNLFSLLADSHTMRVSEVVDLCPPSRCDGASETDVLRRLLGTSMTIMDQRISLRARAESPLDSFGGRIATFGPDNLTPDSVADFVAGFSLDAEQPPFSFFHTIFPHRPFHYLPDGREYAVDDGPAGMLGAHLDFAAQTEDWGSGDWPATLARQRHVLQVMFADLILGAVRDRMIAEGTYDSSVVALVSDHGSGFTPGEPPRGVVGQEITEELAAELLYVPFIVKAPGQEVGRIDDRNALMIDLMPTIADVLDATIPYEVDGVSLFGRSRPDDQKPFVPTIVHGYGDVSLGRSMTFDDSRLWPHVEARAISSFLGPPGDPWRLWRVGPHPELVGQATGDLPEGTLGPIAAELRNPGAYATVSTEGTVPALVIADANGLADGTGVAIVVNGVVAATAPVFRSDDHLLIAAMVDSALYREGSNTVELFEVLPR